MGRGVGVTFRLLKVRRQKEETDTNQNKQVGTHDEISLESLVWGVSVIWKKVRNG